MPQVLTGIDISPEENWRTHARHNVLQGFRAARAGLLTNTYLLAQTVTLDKRSYQALATTADQRAVIEVCWPSTAAVVGVALTAACGSPAVICPSQPWLRLMQMLEEEGDVYSRLARSIAPEIWGHEDVKKVQSAPQVMPSGA
jgi:DNA replication licensing factor MCM7